MRRIASPMVGGMVTAPVLSMFVIPAAYLLVQRVRLRWRGNAAHRLERSSVYATAPEHAS
jgi:Cu(I)/Ag(I) efflux system membrane protein CusA/SilA